MKTFIYKLKKLHPNAEMIIDDYGYVYLEYRENGEYHNINGPAYQCWDKSGDLIVQSYWKSGKRIEHGNWF